MKRLLLIILCLSSISSFAQQPAKGAILVGGDLTANIERNTYKDDLSGNTFETNIVNFGLSPRAGFTLFNGFIVGAIIDVSASRSSFGSDKSTGSRLQAGPFVRYYLPFGLFGEINVTGGIQNSKLTTGGVSSGRNTDVALTGFLGAGFAYFLNDYVSLEPLIGVGYDRIKLDNDDVVTQGGLRFRVSLVFYLRNEQN